MRGKNINKDKISDTILIFSLTFFFAYPIYLCGVSELDEGALLHTAERITKGEVLYRDIATGLMPGIYYLQAILFLVFGYSMEVGRYLQMVVLATNATVLYLISRRFVNRGGSFVVAMLFVATNAFVYRFPNYCPLSILFILLGFLCFLYHLSQRKNIYILLSGFNLALSFLFKQNYGVLVFVPLTLFLLVNALKSKSFKPLILFLFSFTLPILLTMTYFYFHGALDAMVRYTTFLLFSEELTIYRKPYPFFNLNDPLYFIGDIYSYTPFPYLTDWLLTNEFASKELVYGIISATFIIPLLIILISFIYLGIKFFKAGTEEKEIALLSSAIGLFFGVFPRVDFHHLAVVLPFLLVLGGIVIQKVYEKGGLYIRIPSYMFFFSVTLLFIISAYLPLFHNLSVTQDTTLNVERARNIKVSKEIAETIRSAVSYLKEKTGDDEAILAIPSLPLYYFLSDRNNPTPYPLILPGSFDEDIFLRQISKATYIVSSDIALDDVPFYTIFPRTYQYLSDNFVIDKDFLSTLNTPPYCPVFILKKGKETRINSRVINYLKGAYKGIVGKDSGLVPLSGQELLRVKETTWLFKDCIALHPPSGLQKISLSYNVVIPSRAKLNFSLALRPPIYGAKSAGVILDIYIYTVSDEQLVKIFTTRLDHLNQRVWCWEDFEIDLSEFAGKEAILSFVSFCGPTFVNVWNEIFLGEPRIVADETHNNLDVRAGKLPDDVALAIGNFNEPEIFEQAYKNRPNDLKILLDLACIYVNLKRFEEAVSLLNKAVTLDGDDISINLALAECYWAKGEPLLAHGEYEKVLKNDTNNMRALTMLAEINLVAMKNPQQAYYYQKRALRLVSDNSWMHSRMGSIYLSMDKTKEATNEYKRALELLPDNAEALYRINESFQGEKLMINGNALSRANAPLPDVAFKADIKPERPVPEETETGGFISMPVRVKNLSPGIWPALGRPDGKFRIHIGYQWFDSNNFLSEEGRVPLIKDVACGEEIILNISIKAPNTAGEYLLKINMVQEFVGWFEDKNKENQGIKAMVKVGRWSLLE